MTFKGNVYDITSFMPDHPGGDDIIMEYAGTDIGQVMADESQHVHSRSAYDMMEEYKIGELGGDEKIVSEGQSKDLWLAGLKTRLLTFQQTGSQEKISTPMRPMLWPISTETSSSISASRCSFKFGMLDLRRSTTSVRCTIPVISRSLRDSLEVTSSR